MVASWWLHRTILLLLTLTVMYIMLCLFHERCHNVRHYFPTFFNTLSVSDLTENAAVLCGLVCTTPFWFIAALGNSVDSTSFPTTGNPLSLAYRTNSFDTTNRGLKRFITMNVGA